MRLTISDSDIQAKALELGLIQPGEPVPANVRSRIVAALLAEQAPRAAAADVPVAKNISVQPGASVMVDGNPFPWVVQADAIEVTIAPDGSGLVRLTIPTLSVEITKSESEQPR